MLADRWMLLNLVEEEPTRILDRSGQGDVHRTKQADTVAILFRPVDRGQGELKLARQLLGFKDAPCRIGPGAARVRGVRHPPKESIVISVQHAAGLRERIPCV